MRSLNRRYRGIDRCTDVLSFPLFEDLPEAPARDLLLGDVVICVPQALRQAAAAGSSLARELDRLFVHGLLHLLGFDHEAGPVEARRMAAREARILRALHG